MHPAMMRQLTPMSFVKTPADLDAMTLASTSKLYEDAALISAAAAAEDIYHEPSYPRLVLQRPSTFRFVQGGFGGLQYVTQPL